MKMNNEEYYTFIKNLFYKNNFYDEFNNFLLVIKRSFKEEFKIDFVPDDKKFNEIKKFKSWFYEKFKLLVIIAHQSFKESVRNMWNLDVNDDDNEKKGRFYLFVKDDILENENLINKEEKESDYE